MEQICFPRTKEEALALIYVQAQDLSNATPEDILAMYNEAVARLYGKTEPDYEVV